MTKVLEISVPAQKNLGGVYPVCNNAIIHGKEPRVKNCPWTINPDLILGKPQLSALRRDRKIVDGEGSVSVANTANAIKMFLIIIFFSMS